MTITLHRKDLPSGLDLGPSVAVDTETMGLNPARDSLCLVQISAGDGKAHIVQLDRSNYDAPNLKRLLGDPKVVKIFHFARFDLAVIKKFLSTACVPVFCTRTASRLARTYTDKHGLRDLCRELLGIEINKQYQSSDWGSEELLQEQLQYAANDVLYLHDLKAALERMLRREKRDGLAQRCFDFLDARAELDLAGWANTDIFDH